MVLPGCSNEVASEVALVWEGYMGANTPAMLFRNAVNLEVCSSERREVLSTGLYTLVDVHCRTCCAHLGWKYITAARPVSRSWGRVDRVGEEAPWGCMTMASWGVVQQGCGECVAPTMYAMFYPACGCRIRSTRRALFFCKLRSSSGYQASRRNGAEL